jgi:heme-degrading monooxygenase HmoA
MNLTIIASQTDDASNGILRSDWTTREDCEEWLLKDYRAVFKNKRPKNKENVIYVNALQYKN